MLATLLTCLVCLSPQEPVAAIGAVAVRGDAELSPAAAFASARTRVEDHVRELWRDRAERALERQRPFWLPAVLADEAMRRWLADLPVAQMVEVVDREDREREHSFGSSYQTTLWVAEDPRQHQRSEQRLRHELRRLERTTAYKYGGVAMGWTVLLVALGWLDRLTRGYMTGRLRAVGLLAGAAVPVVAFLV
jgi:hypothetical protein